MASEFLKQFQLLTQRRFAPLFWVQFGGALNDNIFKNALIVLVIYHNLSAWGLPGGEIVNIAAALFILPFMLFSAFAGQLADKFEKARLIRYTKLLEIIIIIIACVGFLLNSVELMLVVLFFLGVQATLFGPLKYGILPQYLPAEHLVRGNGLIEMGTFVAILIGTELGAIMITMPQGSLYIMALLLVVALIGFCATLCLPKADAADPNLKIDWNIIRCTWNNLQLLYKNQTVYVAIIAISWFWLYGALVLTQLPEYVKTELNANSIVLAVFFGLFSIGIGVGSVLCSKLSRQAIDLSLVLLGAAGMTIFGCILYFVTPALNSPSNLLTATQFFSQWHAWVITICFLGMSLFAGFYTVPLYTLVQARSALTIRSQMIAANNIVNSFAMVLAAVLAIILLRVGCSVAQIFLVLSALNILAPLYFFWRIPEVKQHLLNRFKF